MKQKPIRIEKEKVYEDIHYQVGTVEGHAVYETMTVDEQIAIERDGKMSVSDVLRFNIIAWEAT